MIVVSRGFNVPSGEANAASAVVRCFIERFGPFKHGILVNVSKGIPPAMGLGSSGATSAGTAYAISELLELELGPVDLLRLAGCGEKHVAGAVHYDNIAASLFGGVVVIDAIKLQVHRYVPSDKFYIAVIAPRLPELIGIKKTEYARLLLPKEVDLATHVMQTSSLAKLLYALFTNNLELLGEAISTDFVVEPYRLKIIPYYRELKKLALDEGALGFNICGAGPSVFSIYRSRDDAVSVGRDLQGFLSEREIESHLIVTQVSEKGVELSGDVSWREG